MGHIVDTESLPKDFPTHLHSAEFWEALGRAVAAFGFLEETLGKAIFAFTATHEIPEDNIDEEFAKWLPTLERALSDPLGGLIHSFETAVQTHQQASIPNFDDLIQDLKHVAAIRNVLCHGSWRVPNRQGQCIPFFVDRKNRIFNTPIDTAYLVRLRVDVVNLTCAVINTVTHMGWQFPGSAGPGIPIVDQQTT
jgi:hypothetical protein